MIQGITSKFVEPAWEYVEDYIADSLKHGVGEYTTDDIKQLCQSKQMQLWIKWDDEEVKGAFVTQILNYPQMKILLVLLLGGNDFIKWRDEVDEVLQRFGKEHNCKFVEFFGRKGWGNYLKDINYKEQVRMFSKEIV
jgi:hypothetical protein